jgi:formylglycine-generating enzyme required for sulfatase activity
MGSANDPLAGDDEEPQHKVNVEGFWISLTEVTNAQYAACVKAGACAPPDNPNYEQPQLANLPVTYVSWHDANRYAEWVGGRLPTEAEWEKACRGTKGSIYPWGDGVPTSALLTYAGADLQPAGSHLAGKSPYGLLDMAGNVYEWTSSLKEGYPYVANDGREDQKSVGARVERGGSFKNDDQRVRCAYRDQDSPDTRLDNVGLRVVHRATVQPDASK